MNIAIIVAIAQNNAIGKNGQLLWHLPADMEHFKQTTMGHHVLMGRKTWESIPEKFRPLKGRVNLIVSNSISPAMKDVHVFRSIQTAIEYAKNAGESELMVIGGGAIYAATLPFANTLYLTRVEAAFADADAFFPVIDESQWAIESTKTRAADSQNRFGMEFVKMIRI